MNIISIDPGPKQSGIVTLINDDITEAGVVSNKDIRKISVKGYVVLIERPDFVSSKAGLSVLDTCWEAGRFQQYFQQGNTVLTLGRKEVQKRLGTLAGDKETKGSTDSEIKKFLVEIYGKDKLKKLTSHAWQAFSLIHVYKNI